MRGQIRVPLVSVQVGTTTWGGVDLAFDFMTSPIATHSHSAITHTFTEGVGGWLGAASAAATRQQQGIE